ncbi:hypothetical protein ACFVVX_33070 [Kitasatospora sp. NPDC058170]|uniref:hypothetical protein n=1 Tax=Kitasatospora sp. NPDC058170 TaxID=3346364 RepID=UPI0036DEB7ED
MVDRNGWLVFQDLETEAERKLWRAQMDRPNQLKPVEIGPPDPRSGSSWPPEVTVRAALLRQMLLGCGPDPKPAILRMEGARISGVLDLGAAEIVCPLELSGCYFDETIRLQQTRAPAIYLEGCEIPAGVKADQLWTRHNLDLSGSVIGHGVVLIAAWIEGQLLLNGTSVSPGERGEALSFHSLTVGRGAHFNGLGVKGVVVLSGGEFGRSLTMERAKLTRPTDSMSISARRITVEGDICLNDGFEAEGEVNLAGSRVKGRLVLSGGHFRRPGENKVLNLDRVVVDQNAYLNDGFEAFCTVSLLDGRIKGSLRCEGGHFHNETDTAFYAAGLVVGRDVILAKVQTDAAHDHEGFSAKGEVVLADAAISGKLDCSGGRFENPGGTALNAEAAQVGNLVFQDGFHADGKVNLKRVRVLGELKAGASLSADQVDLDGLTYTSLDDQMELERRLGWLLKMEQPNLPQVYRQLASVFQGQGEDREAKRVLVTGQRAHFAKRARPIRWAGRIFEWTVGYGYHPFLILIWLVILEIAGGLIFSCLRDDILLSPVYINQLIDAGGIHQSVGTITGGSDTIDDGYPAFQPWLYTLDLLLPVVDLRQSDIWIPHRAAEWCSMFFTIAGWALATCLVIGIGSVFARERQQTAPTAP